MHLRLRLALRVVDVLVGGDPSVLQALSGRRRAATGLAESPRVGERILEDYRVGDPDVLVRSVLVVHDGLVQLPKYFMSFRHFPNHTVSPVER